MKRVSKMNLRVFRVLIFLCLHTGLCEVSNKSKGAPSTAEGTDELHGTVKYPFSETDFGEKKIQSPIDVITSSIQEKDLPVLKFKKPKDTKLKATVLNSGHTAVIHINENDLDKLPSMTGGPLKPDKRYIFEQLHFHWGKHDEWGSEHFIDGEAFSVEAHMVFFNGDYNNFETAATKDDGLAVLTVFAEVAKDANNLLEPLHNKIGQLQNPEATVEISWEDALQWALSSIDANKEYYTYPGSLTTKPHSQNVVFILLPTAITISHDQLNAFRTLHQDNGHLIDKNKRKLQPLNHRPIFKGTIEFEK